MIAGQYRSRILEGPKGLQLRPTSDRLRETLFDILSPGIAGCVFLDVFAGTGAVGIEALSRGARRVILIERQPAALRLIQRNLQRLEVQRGAEVLAGDALVSLKSLETRGVSGDFVFMDPPYRAAAEYCQILQFLGVSAVLAATGRVIVEHPRKLELPPEVARLARVRVAGQGSAALTFYASALSGEKATARTAR